MGPTASTGSETLTLDMLVVAKQVVVQQEVVPPGVPGQQQLAAPRRYTCIHANMRGTRTKEPNLPIGLKLTDTTDFEKCSVSATNFHEHHRLEKVR